MGGWSTALPTIRCRAAGLSRCSRGSTPPSSGRRACCITSCSSLASAGSCCAGCKRIVVCCGDLIFYCGCTALRLQYLDSSDAGQPHASFLHLTAATDPLYLILLCSQAKRKPAFSSVGFLHGVVLLRQV